MTVLYLLPPSQPRHPVLTSNVRGITKAEIKHSYPANGCAYTSFLRHSDSLAQLTVIINYLLKDTFGLPLTGACLGDLVETSPNSVLASVDRRPDPCRSL
jgi:hypothetical protein